MAESSNPKSNLNRILSRNPRGDLPDPDPQILERGVPPGDLEKREQIARGMRLSERAQLCGFALSWSRKAP